MGEKPTRQALPAILKELHTSLDEDWGDYRFAVMSTEDDAVVVRFELDSVESERGLHAYMNVMARSGGAWIRRWWVVVGCGRPGGGRIRDECGMCACNRVVRVCCTVSLWYRCRDEVQAEEGGGGLTLSTR
mgnify:FL=1